MTMSSEEIWAKLQAPRDVLSVNLSLIEVMHLIQLLGTTEMDDQLSKKLAREITLQKLDC